MKKILLDTNAYVAFKRGDPGAVEIVQFADALGFNTVVLGELMGGFAVGTCAARNRRELNTFLDSPRTHIIPISENTAEYYASVFAAQKRKGRPIPTNDLWIAASALETGHALYTYDKHFNEIDGLLSGSRIEDFLP